jgi:hypothetical protein
MPQPMQSSSEMTGFFPSAITMVSSPVRTRGQYLTHSCEHVSGWHRSLFSIAILIMCLCIRCGVVKMYGGWGAWKIPFSCASYLRDYHLPVPGCKIDRCTGTDR